jgi:cytochrome c553
MRMIGLGLALCIGSMASAQGTADIKRGEALVTRNCARCHATMRTGESSQPEAPVFRTLGRRYPIESLEEALGEGLVTSRSALIRSRPDEVCPATPTIFTAAISKLPSAA